MRDRSVLFGYLGLGLLLFGGVLSLVPGAPGALSGLSLIIGGLALVGFLLMNAGRAAAALGRRRMKYGANAVLLSLIVLGIVVLVNFISNRHHRRVDLTSNKRYSLSGQTLKILQGLDRDVKFTAFYREGEGEHLKDLLTEYDYGSDRISYEFVDPDRYPGKARRYGVTSYGTIIAETDEREEKVAGSTEEDITNALLKVTRQGQKVVHFLEGHAERDIHSEEREGYSTARRAVEADNYQVKSHLLMQDGVVPEDCAVLIVAGPQKDLLAHEKEAITKYLEGGGKALFLLDPHPAAGLEDYLKRWGVIVGRDVVVDVSGVGQLFGADEFIPIVTDFGDTDITEDFAIATFFPYARSVTRDEDLGESLSVEILAETSPHSWAETGSLEGTIKFDEGQDTQGPISLAVVITAESKSDRTDTTRTEEEPEERGKARIVVFGDADFASNAYFGLSGNGDLFLNTVSWLAEEEDLIAIRPKSPDTRRVTLTFRQARTIFWFTVVIIPAVVFLTGLSVWWRRRG
ncbi:MAG: GldG family protein [bacterium]